MRVILNNYFRRTLWVYLFTFLPIPVSYLTRVLYARSMTVEDYGIFYGLFGFFSIASILRDWGINNASIYFANKFLVNNEKDKFKTLFYFNQLFQLLLSFVVGFIIYVYCDYIGIVFYGGSLNAVIMIRFYVIYWIIMTIFDTNTTFLDILGKQSVSSILNMFNILSIFIFSIFFFHYYPSNIVPIFSYIISLLLVSISSYIYLLKKYGDYIYCPKLYSDYNFLKPVLKYASSIVIAGFASILFFSTDTVVVQYFLGAESVAYYTTAATSITLLVLFVAPIEKILKPLIANLWHRSEISKISAIVSEFINNIFILLIPVCLSFNIIASDFITLFYGEKYESSIPLFKIFAIAVIIHCLNFVFISIAQGINKTNDITRIVLITGIFDILLNILSVKYYGLYGIVISTAISYLLSFYLFINCFKTVFIIEIKKIHILKIIFSGLLFYFSGCIILDKLKNIFLFSNLFSTILRDFIAIIISMLFYLLLLFIFRILNKSNIKESSIYLLFKNLE